MDSLKVKTDALHSMILVFNAGQENMRFEGYIYCMDRIAEYLNEHFEGYDIWEAIDKKYLPPTAIEAYKELMNWCFKQYAFQGHNSEEKIEKKILFNGLLTDLTCFDGE